MRLTIVLVDAELELAPGAANDRRMPVLDAFYHQDIMRSLSEGSRRGRPDIVHSTLLMCQGSHLNREGRLEVLIHTRDDMVIGVEREKDVHPNYIRFLQDMGSLLEGEQVPGYTMVTKDLRTLVRELGADLKVAMSPSGEDVPLYEAIGRAGAGKVLVMIGAFPEGDYSSPVYELADVKLSLGPRLMRVPEVISVVLGSFPEEK